MVTVAEAVVGDETGVAKLVLRNGKIYDNLLIEVVDQVKEGTTITILNALARIQNENLVIDVDKWARIN